MADVINLRRARKRADSELAERRAAENRALHGRSKHERMLLQARSEKSERDLDAHRRDGEGQ